MGNPRKGRIPKYPRPSAWLRFGGLRYWLVVDGTFTNKRNAYAGARELRERGYRARVVKLLGQITTLWAVYYYNPSKWGPPRPR